MWTMLDKQGTSNSLERIALMPRYLDIFGPRPIRYFLAGRAFKARPRAGGGSGMDNVFVEKQAVVLHPPQGENVCHF